MNQEKTTRTRNLTITGITALTGCVALIVVMVALAAGLWIDNVLGRRGPATICLLVLSVPLSLYLMVWIALTLVKQIQLPTPAKSSRFIAQDEKEE